VKGKGSIVGFMTEKNWKKIEGSEEKGKRRRVRRLPFPYTRITEKKKKDPLFQRKLLNFVN